MTVTAVIPTWNRADLLRKIIENLQRQTRPPECILVVDNGSGDGSAEVARNMGAQVTRFEENRGFAVAVNEGIRSAETDWVFIVNNDVELAGDWLEKAHRAGESGAPFICGKLLRPDETATIDGSWDLVSRGMYAWRCGYGKPDGPVWDERRRIYWAPMTAALYKKSVFEQVGMLDTRFESYYEDVEFGVRCALAGIRGLYDPALTARHGSKTTLGKSSRRVYFYTARNQVFILARHFPPATLRRLAWPVFAGQALSLVAAAKQRNLLAGLRGKWAGLREWRSMRGEFPAGRDRAVESIFAASEKEILDLQRRTGFDSYWRAYFTLCGGR